MVIELLFSAAVGAGTTHLLLQKIDKEKLENLERMYRRACDYHLQGNYKQAISMLLELIKLDDKNPYYYLQLYCSYGKLASTYGKLSSIGDLMDNSRKAFECYDNIVRLDRQGISIPQDLLSKLGEFTTEMKGHYNKLLEIEKERERLKRVTKRRSS